MKKVVFERLEKGRHDRNSFDCGVDELNGFIRTVANQQQNRGLNVVHVACYEDEQLPKKILGFYTLSASSLSFENFPEQLMKRLPSNYPIPTFKIGRLAKDSSMPAGFGGKVLGDALKHALDVSDVVGIVGVDVDAKNEEAIRFYKKYGFLELKRAKALFLPIATLKQLKLH